MRQHGMVRDLHGRSNYGADIPGEITRPNRCARDLFRLLALHVSQLEDRENPQNECSRLSANSEGIYVKSDSNPVHWHPADILGAPELSGIKSVSATTV